MLTTYYQSELRKVLTEKRIAENNDQPQALIDSLDRSVEYWRTQLESLES